MKMCSSMGLNLNRFSYLIASKPPNAGDPITTAKVTIIPKTAITIPRRLFMQKLKLF